MNPEDVDVKDIVYVGYPYEEDPSIIKKRPALIIGKDDENLQVVVVKITKTPPRNSYDYEIVDWVKANLKMQSTARASRIQLIGYADIIRKIGTMEDEDYNAVLKLVEEYIKTI